MGKNDFLTPKAIANRIKAKGLQKLRWYCQMCQKQCRDENGFKCHCMSESHQRQMEVFGHNPHRFVAGYSEEFEKGFLELMRRSHRYSRIASTVVYNEYINDRHHVHMNSTRWESLTGFIKYLGREGKCKIEDTPKGWFMTYIDRDPETIFKEGLQKKRDRADIADEERHDRMVQHQIERASKLAKVDEKPADEEQRILKREEGSSAKIVFAMGKGGAAGDSLAERKGAVDVTQVASVFDADEVEGDGDVDDDRERKGSERGAVQSESAKVKVEGFRFGEGEKGKQCSTSGVKGNPEGRSTLDQLMFEEERAKERSNRRDFWLSEGLVVKVMSRALKEKGFYKQKGIVQKVIGKYVAEVNMVDTKSVLRVDQEELETVLPQIGGLIRIVNGAYRGSNARLLAIDTQKFCAKVQVEKGQWDGRIVPAVQYEDVCKLSV